MGNLAHIRTEFAKHGISNFTPEEIENTGAKLQDVKILLMCALQQVRTGIGRKVRLLYNGLTTGNHKAKEHPEGKAVDFYLDVGDGPINSFTIILVVIHAIRSGFNGIGIYWNGTTYSFHLDLRPIECFALWVGFKNKRSEGWKYITIVGKTANAFDPKEVRK